MSADAVNVESVEVPRMTLCDLYKSTQDHLVLMVERSLDRDRKDLAGQFDDVLLRQRFWEDDIHLDDGALSDLEAHDALASSIIRRYLHEIGNLLHDINRSFSLPPNDIDDEKDQISLLYETNARLCDQVEIFDAIAANSAANSTSSDRKATAIGQLRRQLEEENEMLQSTSGKKIQDEPVPNPFEEPEVEKTLSKLKRKASSTLSSAEPETKAPLLSVAKDKVLVWFCCQCRNLNNVALCPEKCSICAHTLCSNCMESYPP